MGGVPARWRVCTHAPKWSGPAKLEWTRRGTAHLAHDAVAAAELAVAAGPGPQLVLAQDDRVPAFQDLRVRDAPARQGKSTGVIDTPPSIFFLRFAATVSSSNKASFSAAILKELQLHIQP